MNGRHTFSLFRVFNFSVKLEPSWLILGALVAWSLAVGEFPYLLGGLSRLSYVALGVAGAVGLFFSIVAHELCHSLVGRRYGMEMRGITLFMLGGVAEMEDEPPTPRAEFVMAIAGPLSSLVLGGLFMLASSLLTPVASALGVLAWWLGEVNIMLALFNLIPAFPLDGGRMLRAALWHWRRDMLAATRIASLVGQSFGILLIVIGLCNVLAGNFIGGIWEGVIGWYLRQAAGSTLQWLLVREALRGERVADFVERSVLTVPASATLARFADTWLAHYPTRVFPVLDGERVVGTIGAAQTSRVPRAQWPLTLVAGGLQPLGQSNSIAAEAAATEALTRLSQDNLSWLVVVEPDGRFAGIVTLQRLLDRLAAQLGNDHNDTPPLTRFEQPFSERYSSPVEQSTLHHNGV